MIRLAVVCLALSIGAFFYVENQAQAQALQLAKPFTGQVNKTISGALSKRLNNMGFASNDPIYAATMAASQNVVQLALVGGTVATTVAAVSTAPVWLSVALGLGAAYEIYDFTMGKLDFNADVATGPYLQATASGSSPVSYVPPGPAPEITSPLVVNPWPHNYADVPVGQMVVRPSDMSVCAYIGAYHFCGPDVATLRAQAYTIHHNGMAASGTISTSGTLRTVYTPEEVIFLSQSGPTVVSCTISKTCPEAINHRYIESYNLRLDALKQYQEGGVWYDYVYEPGETPPADMIVAKTLTYFVYPNPDYLQPGKLMSVNDAATKLDTGDLQTHADPELLAAIANKIWQEAAQQPGYEGAPYDVNNPVTAQDILDDIAAGLYPHPTNYDLLSLPYPSGSTQVAFDPEAIPAPDAAPSQEVQLDLGPDPGIGEPMLEDSPTGQTIVGYVLGLMPTFSAFTIPAHQSECLMPTFDFFGNTMSMQGACQMVEDQRAILSTIFSAIWSVAAFTFVLRA